MLNISTYLKEIEGKGVGVFANEDVWKFKEVWTYGFPDISIHRTFQKDFDKEIYDFMEKYGWIKNDYLILAGDNFRFVNHCDTPNISTDGKSATANRDIKKGEELTCSYFEICDWIKEKGLNFSQV